MKATPYQTYLEERLQSARGLGWPVTVERGTEDDAAPAPAVFGDALRYAQHILRMAVQRLVHILAPAR